MKNTMTDLHNHLFQQLEAVCDDDLDGAELDQAIKRADAACKIAGTIIKGAQAVTNAMKAAHEAGVEVNEHTMPMLAALERRAVANGGDG